MISNLVETYDHVASLDTDIKDHLPKLKAVAAACAGFGPIVELGVRGGASTIAFLAGLRSDTVAAQGRLVSVDLEPPPAELMAFAGPDWTYYQTWSTDPLLVEKVLEHGKPAVVFIDTNHDYALTCAEFGTWAPHCDYLIFHDVAVKRFPHHNDRDLGERQGPGEANQPDYPVLRAVLDMSLALGWSVDVDWRCNGLASCVR